MHGMKFPRLVLALLTCLTATAAMAQAGDPTPRTFMGPDSASKVRVYEAKRWRNFGVDPQALAERSVTVTPTGRSKACNTTIGPSAGGTSSGRYGPGNARSSNDSTVIVTGDVINVCK
jgi:hypothetical protein